MSKRTIWIITTVMALALIGLATIQWNWVLWSVRLDEEKFDEKAQTVLSHVRDKLVRVDQQRFEKLIQAPRDSVNALWSKHDGSDYDVWRSKKYYAEYQMMRENNSKRRLQERISPKMLERFVKSELYNQGLRDIEVEYGIYDNSLHDFVILNGNFTVVLPSGAKSEGVKGKGLYTSPLSIDLFEDEMGRPLGALKIFFPKKISWLWTSAWPLLLSSILLILLVTGSFAYVVWVIFRQKKVSQMKSDFINNMTHEFKTPLATIGLASDNILNQKILESPEKVKRFIEIIKQENKRMLGQVEKVLQMARFDRKKVKLTISSLDMHELIRNAVNNMDLSVKKKNGKITMHLDAEKHRIEGDSTHISNIIHNLLDNAIKYTERAPEIVVSTRNNNNGIVIEVKDNGIGLSKEAMKEIFSNFYRVHTGNVHNVKGFGLGLSIVKSMTEAHGGKVSVKSEPGKGSTFTVFLPFKQKVEE